MSLNLSSRESIDLNNDSCYHSDALQTVVRAMNCCQQFTGQLYKERLGQSIRGNGHNNGQCKDSNDIEHDISSSLNYILIKNCRIG